MEDKNQEVKFICHSGGCLGADMTWEVIGEEFDVNTIAYSFPGHTQYGTNPYILSAKELNEGFERVKIASLSLGMKISEYWPPSYVKKLLSRNWFQVKNSYGVFAIGTLKTHNTVNGGTGWAVQMAIDEKKLVFLFDQNKCHWFNYNYYTGVFEEISYIPILTRQFAGIGTRKINDAGVRAIVDVYENMFGEKGT